MGERVLGYACQKCFGVFKKISEISWKKIGKEEEKAFMCDDCFEVIKYDHTFDGDIAHDVYQPHETGVVKKVPTDLL